MCLYLFLKKYAPDIVLVSTELHIHWTAIEESVLVDACQSGFRVLFGDFLTILAETAAAEP